MVTSCRRLQFGEILGLNLIQEVKNSHEKSVPHATTSPIVPFHQLQSIAYQRPLWPLATTNEAGDLFVSICSLPHFNISKPPLLPSQSSHGRDSIISDANSAYSQATSTRHMLASLNNDFSDYGDPFSPPSAPFMHDPSRDSSFEGSTTNLSLSVNYIPSKFSEFRNRKRGKYDDAPSLPKRGGGLQAFKSNESRMPQGKGRLRWNKFKWILFFTNSLVCFL